MSVIPNQIILGNALAVLACIPSQHVDLVYIDPPFNTGKKRQLKSLKTTRDDDGDRKGFGEHLYREEEVSDFSYTDQFDNYLDFLEPHLVEVKRILSPQGSIYVHVDWRESAHVRLLMDEVFGPENFLNEIIWAYDYGGRGKTCWPRKHDNIYFYAKEHGQHVFNWDEIERIPYMAPGLVTPEKAARGKVVTDVWWHTIVGTNSHEKTGYPTQKPLGILKRIVSASSRPKSWVVDFFAGSGSIGQACVELDRQFILVDQNPEAFEVMSRRFATVPNTIYTKF